MLEDYEINDLALELRRSWGIDNYNPINIVSLFLDKLDNLTIIWMEMDKEISGCCSKNKNNDFVVLINSSHSKGRQNFTLAHEIYHLLYQSENDLFFCNENNKEDYEKEADKFASFFLMPKLALKEYKNIHNIEKWNIENIIRCEQYFQISHLNMLCRLRREKWISYDEFCEYRYNIKDKVLKLGFDTSLYDNLYRGKKYFVLGHLLSLIDKVYSKDKISQGLKNELLVKNFRSDIAYNLEEELIFYDSDFLLIKEIDFIKKL